MLDSKQSRVALEVAVNVQYYRIGEQHTGPSPPLEFVLVDAPRFVLVRFVLCSGGDDWGDDVVSGRLALGKGRLGGSLV